MATTITGGDWSYSGDPAASNKDAVRHLIGDTDETDQQLSDQEIEYELASAGGVRRAAANAAKALSGRFTRLCTSKKVGDLAVGYANRAQEYRNLAAELDAESGLNAVGYAGGISYQDKWDQENDTDRVEPSFTVGAMDNPDADLPPGDSSTGRAQGY